MELKDHIDRFKQNEERVNIFTLGNENAFYTTPDGITVPSLHKYLNDIAEAGFFEPFQTEVELLASIPTVAKTMAKALDTGKVFLWLNGAWNDSGLSELDQALQAVNTSNKAQESISTHLFESILAIVEIISNVITGINNANDTSLATVNLMNGQMALVSFLSQTGGFFDESEKLHRLYSQQTLLAQLIKLDRFDPDATGVGGVNSVMNKASDNVYDFPLPTSIIKIDFQTSANIPTAKGDVINGFAVVKIDGASIGVYATLEVQGNTSSLFPKKNWTLGFFNSPDYEDTVKFKVGDVPPHDEWVYKANYVDASQIRNILATRFWRSMADSRSGFPKNEIDRYYAGKTGDNAIYSGAIGVVEGYPCTFNINGEFYGAGTFNIGKKYFNYNLDRSKANNILIDWGSLQVDLAKLSTNYTNSEIFEIKSPKKVTSTTVDLLKAWDNFVLSSQADFTANADKFMLKSNVIDYWLFSDLLMNFDGIGKNFQFVMQGDGKFLFMPYDLDTVFGANQAGDGMMAYDSVLTKDDLPANTIDFWNKVKTAYSSDMRIRYSELRKKGVFTVENVYKLGLNLSGKFPKELLIEDRSKWSGIPSVSYSNLSQITDWVVNRLKYLDTKYNYVA